MTGSSLLHLLHRKNLLLHLRLRLLVLTPRKNEELLIKIAIYKGLKPLVENSECLAPALRPGLLR